MEAMVEHHNGVALFTICRPEKRNAINFAVMHALEQAIEQAAADDGVKVFAITGAGGEAFCSGGDLSEFGHLRGAEAKQMLTRMGELLYKLLTFPKPTAALVNGTAMGGGCELATACDFRFVKEGSRIGFVQGQLGITTGWGGASMLLEKLPYARALDLLLRAEPMTAEAMAACGWADAVLPADRWREQWQAQLAPYAARSLTVLQAYKAVSCEKWRTAWFREQFFAEIDRCAGLWGSAEHEQALRPFLRKK
ncbi:enoyl-CoA hydratase/isomerase family protein [Geobacillus subterraneus]|uniref:enoyl-CoA hydratase/isomerase family protein n=1 Tax=Geobacillus subterraneus TaxID=129338 RepID=UPI001442D7F4|nr:enoyl-CoA hydratase/isomerase family protein [Geobacillus subterraneus]QIZ67230.1 enoyl-CoA hydratase/isomerase family protein [Geobacillus subterraneus]